MPSSNSTGSNSTYFEITGANFISDSSDDKLLYSAIEVVEKSVLFSYRNCIWNRLSKGNKTVPFCQLDSFTTVSQPTSRQLTSAKYQVPATSYDYTIALQILHNFIFPLVYLYYCSGVGRGLATDLLLMERGMVNVNLVYGTHVTDNDPRLHPVLIVGQLKNLNRIKFDDIKCKLGGRVSEEDFQLALKRFSGSHNDPVNLYLNYATIAPLPDQASRHNAPARPHALTKVVKSETFDVDGESIVVVCERIDIFALGCSVARAFPLYSRKFARVMENTTVTVAVEFLVLEEDGSVSVVTKEEAAALQSAADGIRLAARIVDTPCNEMNVDAFVNEVQQVAHLVNVKVSVIRGEELKEKGMGGIYGVGKAAVCPPALAVLSHMPPGATQTIAWVGKGIVYDSGGLSIKSKTEMPGMKRDCGGAAAILGAFYATVKQGFTQNLHAVFCLAENSVGPNSTRPDDVHTLYSGRTVEINNTDAEGRLVLADGVVYASRDLKADLILDMATLTGAQAISTGKYHSAVLTNSPEWEKNVVTAGRTSGDLAFPIVYCPELHFSEFTSAIADMKNSVADRHNAQSSCAGLFVAAHLGFDFPGVWIHVDMAAPVHAGERATGYGVALLTALFGGFSSDKYLQYVGQNVLLNCAKHNQTNLS